MATCRTARCRWLGWRRCCPPALLLLLIQCLDLILSDLASEEQPRPEVARPLPLQHGQGGERALDEAAVILNRENVATLDFYLFRQSFTAKNISKIVNLYLNVT